MGGIVCAIRGGPDSQTTIARSVALGKRTGLPLYFLYVVNLDFLSHTSSSRTQTISEQMRQMGEFILLAAQSSAAAQGVTAQGLVRHGSVSEEIARLCHELGATYLVLGRPQVEKEGSLFTHTQIEQFIERIEAQTGAQVVLADGEDR